MAMLNFDAREVEPAVGFEPVPAGKYLATITESQMKVTKAGTGQFLELAFQILEGECKGRMLWSRLNLDNPSAMAVKIARAELSALCRAVAVLAPRDSAELHNLPLVIKVGCVRRADTDEITNEIRGYEPRQHVEATTASSGSPPPWDH